MLKLQELLGLESDLSKILNKTNPKEFQAFREQKDAKIRAENLDKIKSDLENKIERLHKVIDDQKNDFLH